MGVVLKSIALVRNIGEQAFRVRFRFAKKMNQSNLF